jgi:hypothetical protein
MVTFLDIGLLGHFSIIFPFLLVFLGAYAMLSKLEFLSKDKGINAIIALCLAAITLFSKSATQLILVATPWFTVTFMGISFLLILFLFMGVKEDKIKEVMEVEWHAPHWIALIILILIGLGAAGTVFGPSLANEGVFVTQGDRGPVQGVDLGINQTGENQFQSEVTSILFHPKVLGILVLLLIAVFTIRTLAYEPPNMPKKE